MSIKLRKTASGVHIFNRTTGMNCLLDEIIPPKDSWSLAPRHISIALTNLCNLSCEHCYAPKHNAYLDLASIVRWACELDGLGAIGIGFGGGEPTLHPDFIEICKQVHDSTALAVSFTSHGHQLSETMVSQLSPYVHFVRLSMDGCGNTYERIRGRSFQVFQDQLGMISSKIRFGVNFVVNDETVGDLNKINFLHDLGCEELLILPQHATDKVPSISAKTHKQMTSWVAQYSGSMRLSVAAYAQEGLPTCNVFSEEKEIENYAHVDADGFLKETSYSNHGVKINISVLDALTKLKHTK